MKQAQRAHRQATGGGVNTMWQQPGEIRSALDVRVNQVRGRVPANRLLAVVCTPSSNLFGACTGICPVELPPKHFALLHPSRRARYRVLKGGRGAAKSHSIARAVIARAVAEPIVVGCFREIQNSIRDSVHKLLTDTIHKLGLSRYFDIGVQYIKSHAGAQFLFEGLWANVNRIRSLEGLDIAWVEEAAKVSEQSWEVLIPTIRSPNSEILVNYNPEAESDPTHQRLAVNTPPNALVEHFTFEDNPYFPTVLRAEAEYLHRVDDDAFRHVWLGETRAHSDAQILRGKVTVEEFEPKAKWSGPYHGLDFGFSQDPTAAIRCYVDEATRTLYISHECWAVGCDIDATPPLLDTIPDASRYLMRADCSRPETISYLQAHGYPNVIAVEKWSGSVEDGVAFIRQFEKVIIHPRCTHTLEESRLYSFKVDRLTGDVLPDVVDKHNHTMDALRYALQPLIQGRGAGLMAYYAGLTTEVKAEQEKAATGDPLDPHHDPHHVVQKVYLLGARPTALLERAKREKAVVSDV